MADSFCVEATTKTMERNILLDANENAYGPGLALSEDGKLANGNAAHIEVDLLGLNRYPDPYAFLYRVACVDIKTDRHFLRHQHELKQMLIDLRNTHVHTKKDLTPSNLFVGVGSDEAIDALLRAFCTPGKDKILTCPPTYGMYSVSAQVNDVEVVKVPLNVDESFRAQPKEINAKLSEDPSIKMVLPLQPRQPHRQPRPQRRHSTNPRASELERSVGLRRSLHRLCTQRLVTRGVGSRVAELSRDADSVQSLWTRWHTVRSCFHIA